MPNDPVQLNEQGKTAFQNGEFDQAADFFRQAVEAYTAAQDHASAAESKNNLSVALLQAGQHQDALDSALGTDEFFEGIKDIKRQAMALGNQAAAFEALERYDEALAAYEKSADLFAQADEGDLRAMVLQSAAGIKLKTGKITESAFKMMGSLQAKKNLSFFDRIMKFFLRFTK